MIMNIQGKVREKIQSAKSTGGSSHTGSMMRTGVIIGTSIICIVIITGLIGIGTGRGFFGLFRLLGGNEESASNIYNVGALKEEGVTKYNRYGGGGNYGADSSNTFSQSISGGAYVYDDSENIDGMTYTGPEDLSETGYDTTDGSFGTNAAIAKLQDQIDDINRNGVNGNYDGLDSSLRGKADINDVANAINASNESIYGSLDDLRNRQDKMSDELNNLIASSSSADSDALKKMRNNISSLEEADKKINSTVTANSATTATQIKNLESSISAMGSASNGSLNEFKKTQEVKNEELNRLIASNSAADEEALKKLRANISDLEDTDESIRNTLGTDVARLDKDITDASNRASAGITETQGMVVNNVKNINATYTALGTISINGYYDSDTLYLFGGESGKTAYETGDANYKKGVSEQSKY